MNRQNGVWITIICILVIGISVTKMTSNFISSGTIETTAEAPSEEPAKAAAAPVKIAAAGGAPETLAAAENTEPETEAAAEPAGSEAVTTSGSNVPEAVMFRADRAEEVSAADSGSPASEASLYETDAAPENTAFAETVKSPLDPAGPGYNTAGTDAAREEESDSCTPAEYKKRLDQTASQIAQYRGAAGDNSASAQYMSAEYEWGLWDSELNTLYALIRARMSDDEAEKLKQEELAWLKDRDAAAEKAASKVNSQGPRNTAYLEASAKETKGRCYKLLEEYGEVLEREPK